MHGKLLSCCFGTFEAAGAHQTFAGESWAKLVVRTEAVRGGVEHIASSITRLGVRGGNSAALRRMHPRGLYKPDTTAGSDLEPQSWNGLVLLDFPTDMEKLTSGSIPHLPCEASRSLVDIRILLWY